MTLRLVYLVSHPIQYQAPLLARIAREPGIHLRVLFERDTSAGYHDPGFGREIRWDVPLREGYESALLDEVDGEAEIRRADAVWMHGWQSRRFRRLMRVAAGSGVPVLMRGENTEAAMPDGPGLRGMAKRVYLRGIFRRCAGFLAIGSDNADYYRRCGVAEERIFLMPYAVDNERFAQAAKAASPGRAALRRQLGLDPARPIILFSGKLEARKHPDTLLAAWRRLAPEPCDRPHLLFAGDGERLAALKAAAEEGVHFLGFYNQGELPALYDLADVFVLASEREPWGLAVNEAMACSTAVVVSDQCGCARDLVDSQCGTVVPPGDAAALAAALGKVLPRAEEAGAAAAASVAAWDFEADVAGLRCALAHVTGGAP